MPGAKPKCLVIGAGIAGAAAAHSLARRGADVTVLEQFDLFHDQGSSHGPTRLFRIAYFEHPDYVPIARRSLALWRDLETASSQKILHQTGVLVTGDPRGVALPGIEKAATLHHLDIKHFTRRAFQQKFPWFSLPPSHEAIVEPDAGLVLADIAHHAFVNGAKASGAQFAEQTKVTRWSSGKNGVEVQTDHGVHVVDKLIITAGLWAGDLLQHREVKITSVQKFLFWLRADNHPLTLEAGFMPFAIETEDQRFFYGFPAIDGDGVKLAEHTRGEAPLHHNEDSLKEFLKEYAPGLPSAISKWSSCYYEMSDDADFIIDRHPQDDRVVFAAGLSGHGFKFAPAIGEALADLALLGNPNPYFDFLRADRFAAA